LLTFSASRNCSRSDYPARGTDEDSVAGREPAQRHENRGGDYSLGEVNAGPGAFENSGTGDWLPIHYSPTVQRTRPGGGLACGGGCDRAGARHRRTTPRRTARRRALPAPGSTPGFAGHPKCRSAAPYLAFVPAMRSAVDKSHHAFRAPV